MSIMANKIIHRRKLADSNDGIKRHPLYNNAMPPANT